MKRYSVGLGMTDDFDKSASVVWGRQKSEEEGLRSEWWLRK